MPLMLGIDRIRKELNSLPFRNGVREVFVGRVSEMFKGESVQTIADRLHECEQELRSHMLLLIPHEDDPDALFVVQELRALPPDMSRMAEGMKWVSKITTVALEMVLPGLAGVWLDVQLGTRFLALLGFVLGVPLGIWHVIAMTRHQPGMVVAKR